jgi:hypothetical protein
MKTVKEWIDTLPEDIREKAYKYQDFAWDSECDTLSKSLISAFEWELTHEGSDYWGDIHDKARDGWFGEKPDTKELTAERGKNYGHPYDHFQCTQEMFDVWTSRRFDAPSIDPELERCLRHITYLILDKLSRAAENPMWLDNFDDIQGYASLWEKVIDKHGGEQ